MLVLLPFLFNFFAICCLSLDLDSLSLPTFNDRFKEFVSVSAVTTPSSSVQVTHRLHGQARPNNMRYYQQIKRLVSPDEKHTGIFFLRQHRLTELEDLVHRISHPLSGEYGRHLSLEEVRALTIDEASVRHVIAVLQRRFNFSPDDIEVAVTGDFITVRGSVKHWQHLLDTSFHFFEHIDDPTIQVLRATKYSLPVELVDHVDCVLNTVHFPVKSSLRYHPTVSSDFPTTSNPTSTATHSPLRGSEVQEVTPLIRQRLNGYVTPALLFDFYDVSHPIGNDLASQGVYETIGQTYSPSDLTLFQTSFNLTRETVTSVIGGHASDATCINKPDDCGEANLDVQYLMATAQRVPTTYYYWSGNDFMLQWMTEVASMTSPPLVFSISYGADEEDLPANYGNTFNVIALKLAARGITITVSSGDDGAQSSSARKSAMLCGYHASFPASSPYVTAVGGTMGPESDKAEVACQGDKKGIITTGGGFSALYGRPTWQADVVSTYLGDVRGTDKEPFAGFPINGRGYPDISLLAHNYVITIGGNFTAVSGTSASSPVFAGMISLVNSERLKRSQPPLGWVNPALYLYASQFINDVTEGDNHCVALGKVCCAQGYSATSGWDAVTGLGSVNFPSFLSTMLSIATAPTIDPVTAPTLSPTAKIVPTSAPTQAPGWVMIEEYTEENCGGEISAYSSSPTNICFPEYVDSSSTDVIGSRRYHCEEYGVVVSYYSDEACSDSYLLQKDRYSSGCAYKVEDYYYATKAHSLAISCTTTSFTTSPPYPLNNPSFTGKYAVHRSYDSTTGCETSALSAVEGMKENHCFNDAANDYSYSIAYPVVSFYSGVDCKRGKKEGTENLPTTCSVVPTDEYRRRLASEKSDVSVQYDYGESTGTIEVYEVWSELTAPPVTSSTPTPPPSTHPSFNPSPLPSSLPSTLSPSISRSESVQPSNLPTIPQRTSLPTTFTTSTDPPTTSFTSLQPTSLPSITTSPTYLQPSSLPSITVQPTPLPSTLPVTSGPTPAPTPTQIPTTNPTTLAPFSLNPTISATNEPVVTSAAPSFAPSTPSPTSTAQVVTVSFAQVLRGISYSTWQSASADCVRVFTNAIERIVSDLEPLKIEIKGVKEVPSITSDRTALKEVVARINVTYAVSINSQTSGFGTDGDNAAKTLTSRVVSAVTAGDVNTYLTYYASTDQVQEMMGVISPAIAVIGSDVQEQSSGTDEPNTTSSDTSSFSATGVILAAVVGSVLAMGLVLVGVYYCVQKYHSSVTEERQRAARYAIVDLNSDSSHNLMDSSAHLPQRQFSHYLASAEEDEVGIELADKRTVTSV